MSSHHHGGMKMWNTKMNSTADGDHALWEFVDKLWILERRIKTMFWIIALTMGLIVLLLSAIGFSTNKTANAVNEISEPYRRGRR